MDTLNAQQALSKEKLWNKEAAISRLGGNEGLLNRIVEMFLAQIEQKQNALQASVEAEDAEGVRFNSHAMKGVSGDVGADAIREKAAEIEVKAKQGDLSNVVSDMAALDDLIQQTVDVMRA
ncbi:sensor/response hybrid [Alteromonas mediterranea 615]|uniref:Sensor/response hybrid n=1 Tax=Alteromonas mediterranea 615 TaxID=1300253 RepID=S5AD85_9ALTE|nr:sensor/response hybrid [Alteromonas mediterranea 615]